jgi:hypothetical protein
MGQSSRRDSSNERADVLVGRGAPCSPHRPEPSSEQPICPTSPVVFGALEATASILERNRAMLDKRAALKKAIRR